MHRTNAIEQAIRILSDVRDGTAPLSHLDSVAELTAAALNADPDGQQHVLSSSRRQHGGTRKLEASDALLTATRIADATRRGAHFSSDPRIKQEAERDAAFVEASRRHLKELDHLYRASSAADPVFLPLGALVRLKRDQVEDEAHGSRWHPLKAGNVGVVTMNDPTMDWPVRVTFDHPIELVGGHLIHRDDREYGSGHFVDAEDMDILSFARTTDGSEYRHLIVAFPTHVTNAFLDGTPGSRYLLLRDGRDRTWSFLFETDPLRARSADMFRGALQHIPDDLHPIG